MKLSSVWKGLLFWLSRSLISSPAGGEFLSLQTAHSHHKRLIFVDVQISTGGSFGCDGSLGRVRTNSALVTVHQAQQKVQIHQFIIEIQPRFCGSFHSVV